MIPQQPAGSVNEIIVVMGEPALRYIADAAQARMALAAVLES
jgi:hypothetical protein